MKLVSTPELFQLRVAAEDGFLGRVKDVLVDPVEWDVRRFVVDTARWFPGRRVAIPPEQIRECDVEGQTLRTRLSTRAVRKYPHPAALSPLAKERPVEDWMYEEVYFKNPPFDVATDVTLMSSLSLAPAADSVNSHLQSVADLDFFDVIASGEKMGFVNGVVMETHSFWVPYLLVDLGNWFSPDIVTVPTSLVRSLDEDDRQVSLSVHPKRLEMAPRVPLHRMEGEWEDTLLRFFDREFEERCHHQAVGH